MTFRLEWNLSLVADAVGDATADALEEVAEAILSESTNLVPIDEGTLARSGHVERSGDSVAVVYDTPYAVAQHERMDYQHPNGRQAKYLETAANLIAPLAPAMIAAHAQRRVS